MTKPQPTEWMNSVEVAEMVRAPEQTLRYWRWKGTGPKGTKVGRRVLYRRSDVEAWLVERERAQHGQDADPPPSMGRVSA